MLHEQFLLHIPPSLPLSSSCLAQLKYMMVMTGYPDFLLKPELIDQEYGVSLQLPVSLCMEIFGQSKACLFVFMHGVADTNSS